MSVQFIQYIFWGLLFVAPPQSTVVGELMALNEAYKDRMTNMHLSMKMEVKDQCWSGEKQSQNIDYYYLGKDIYAKTTTWEMLYSGETYVFVDHINQIIMVSPSAANAMKSKQNHSTFENLQKLVETEAESRMEMKENGSVWIEMLPSYGDYSRIEILIGPKYTLKTLKMEGRTSREYGSPLVKEKYCINITFENEERGNVSPKHFNVSKYLSKQEGQYKLQPKYENYKLSI